MKPETLRKEIQRLRAIIEMAEEELESWLSECTHEIKPPFKDYVVCDICEADLGWYCPKNPNHYCQYNEDEDPSHDDCIHCHMPEERK